MGRDARSEQGRPCGQGGWAAGEAQVLGIEGGDGHWSLVSRLMLANEVLDAADAAGAPPGLFTVVPASLPQSLRCAEACACSQRRTDEGEPGRLDEGLRSIQRS